MSDRPRAVELPAAGAGVDQPAATPETIAFVGTFARRTERLAPLYEATILTLTWSFRIGAALLLIGVGLAAARREPLHTATEPFAAVIPSLLSGQAAGVVDLAILWLMLSPVLAVVVVIVGFWRLGDRRYALLSLLVLAVLGVSIALSLRR